MFNLEAVQEAIRQEGVGGWLFSSFQHRDTLSESILEIDKSVKNTRPWYYIVYPEGSPTKIVHAIEQGVLDHLPGEKVSYDSRDRLMGLLKNHVLPKAPRIACQFSPTLRVISFMDHGTCLLLEECGFSLVSAASLLQRFQGLLTEEMALSHERAAKHLGEIVDNAWELIRKAFSEKKQLHEGDVRDFMMKEFERRGLVTYSPPLVACGPNSGNPHYTPPQKGAPITPNQVLQLDLWAKEKGENGTYADISWVGFTGPKPPTEALKVFSILVEARDRTLAFIEGRLSASTPVSGKEVDAFCRAFLREGGYEKALRHRTGHGIDREVHGFGVNLDSVEFPDDRLLLDGSCFSVEPGLYFDSFGMRTEVNGYVWKGQLRVSGPKKQTEILTL